MLKGLTAFTEGLVEHGLKFRSEKNDETIPQGINREISDMTRLLAETHHIDDSAKRLLTEGIVKYALGLYLVVRKGNVDDYKELVQKLCEYFKAMDNKYYSELEGGSDDMEKLVKFLNEFPIILHSVLEP